MEDMIRKSFVVRVLFKAKLWLCSSLFSWLAIVLKALLALRDEQRLRETKVGPSFSPSVVALCCWLTSPAGCAFKHHVPCLLRKGQVWNDKQRGTNRISEKRIGLIFTSVLEHKINRAVTWRREAHGCASVSHLSWG